MELIGRIGVVKPDDKTYLVLCPQGKEWCAVTIRIPDEVLFIINTLETAGYEAYAVGGCVRDSLLGAEPKDWDICTSALPGQTMKCFAGHRIIETGLRHGTITLILDHKPFEITTFRVDGIYSDNRRPDKVEFVSDLKEDLSRRDFTINSIACNPRIGVVDLFNGVGDLKAGSIRCVGDAEKRFQEDALRIMRALRFASVFSFSIDADTSKAMHSGKSLLQNIAVERIAAELNKLVIGEGVREVLSAHLPVLVEIIPEFEQAVSFVQNNKYHCYDVMTHILHSVSCAPKDLLIRLTLLFHDIAKPNCYNESSDGAGHFHGHAKMSSDMACEILTRLKYDNDTIKAVTQLVAYHDSEIRHKIHVKRWLNRIGEERLRQLVEVKRADSLAHAEVVRGSRQDVLDGVLVLIDEIIARQQCFSLKDLAVNGRDLMAAGVPEGKQIGVILGRLLELVISDKAENDKTVLLGIVKELAKMNDEPLGSPEQGTGREKAKSRDNGEHG